MPKLQLKTKLEIQRDLINAVVARTSLSDLTDSSTLKHFITAVASEITGVYYQFTNLASLFDFNLAAGTDLDERAKEILGATLERLQARRAVGTLVFTRAVSTGSPVTIPAGTVVETADGVAVETTEAGTILAGQTDSAAVDAQASETGEDGNIGSVTAVVFRGKPAGVDAVSNSAVFAHGRDRESDDQFRQRILATIETLARCTPDALAFAVLGATDPGGSGKTVVFSRTVEDANAPGTAIVYVDDGTGNIRDAVEPNQPPTRAASSLAAATGAPATQTLTDSGANFGATAAERAKLVGQHIVITDTKAAVNAGPYRITAVPSATTITYANTSGTAEAAPTADYVIGELVTLGLLNDAAVGGEEFLQLNYKPIEMASEQVHLVRGNTITKLYPDTQTTPPNDYDVRWSTGLAFFAGNTGPLQPGDYIVASYTYFTGAIAEAQRIIDGDPVDRLNYPGWRAAGVDVRVLPPTSAPQTVVARLSVLEGYTRAAVVANAKTAISAYINNLGIGNDVVRHELVERIMGVAGVYDVNLTVPAANVNIRDAQLARITDLNNDVA